MVLATPGTGAITAPCSAAGPTAAGHTLCLPGMCWASWALVALVPVALAMDLSSCCRAGGRYLRPPPADAWTHITARPGASRKDEIAERVVFGMDRMAAAGGTMPKRTRGGIPSGLRPAQRAVIAATSRSNRPGRLGAGSQPAAQRAGRSPPRATVVGERRDAGRLVAARTGRTTRRGEGRTVVPPPPPSGSAITTVAALLAADGAVARGHAAALERPLQKPVPLPGARQHKADALADDHLDQPRAAAFGVQRQAGG